MKWVLIVTWIAIGRHSDSADFQITEWSTLKECNAIGARVQRQFMSTYGGNITVQSSCAPSDSSAPSCGGTGMEPCK